jgi:hypothetical protein
VRHLGRRASVELGDEDLERARADRARIVDTVRAAGYIDVSIDDRPLRSGSFAGRRPLPVVTP